MKGANIHKIRLWRVKPCLIAFILIISSLLSGCAEFQASLENVMKEAVKEEISSNIDKTKENVENFIKDFFEGVFSNHQEEKTKKEKESDFALLHPIISYIIGNPVQDKGNTNISTNSVRFAFAFLKAGIKDDRSGEGDRVNAMRHAIWIATITNKWGEDIGLEIGNAHEENHKVLEGLDVYNHRFNTLPEADEAIDLLNNIIGREIGANRKNSEKKSNMKEITKDVLDYYNKEGLHIAKEIDGGFEIIHEKLPDKEYQEALEILETLDKNGFPPDNKYHKSKWV